VDCCDHGGRYDNDYDGDYDDGYDGRYGEDCECKRCKRREGERY
jgi:hypothetical protein